MKHHFVITLATTSANWVKTGDKACKLHVMDSCYSNARREPRYHTIVQCLHQGKRRIPRFRRQLKIALKAQQEAQWTLVGCRLLRVSF